MADIQKITSEDLMNLLVSNNFPKVFENYSDQDLENKLAVYINELIDKDFNRLVNLLYRIDISEDKLNSSGKTIAKLIIERQLQKLEFRKKFGKKNIES